MRIRSVRGFVFLLARCALLLASSVRVASGAEQDSSGVVVDSAGVQIVENPGDDRPLAWTLQERLRLGTAVGDPHEEFYQLNDYSVAIGAGDEIFVLDRGNKRILAFSATGAFLHEFGRGGGGPGEMQNPVSIWRSPNDHLSILDWASGSVLEYTSSGELIEEKSGRPIGRGMHMEDIPAGRLFIDTEGLRGGKEIRTQVEMLKLAGSSKTVALARWEKKPTRHVFFDKPCRFSIDLWPLFEPSIVWDAEGDRVALNREYGYVIDVYEGDRRVRSIRRNLAPRNLTLKDAVRELGPTPGWIIGGRRCVFDPEVLAQERGFYPQLQAIEQIRLAPDGYLWVTRRELEENGPIDVFDPAGSYLGTLPAGTAFPVAFTGAGGVVTIEKDDLDVEQVAVYDIVRH